MARLMERMRWLGTYTSLATMVFDPVPRMPATCQVSSIDHSVRGISARPSSIGLPSLSTTGTPSTAQSACEQPLANAHLPVTSSPPLTAFVLDHGGSTPHTRASGLSPQTSRCARSGYRLAAQWQMLM